MDHPKTIVALAVLLLAVPAVLPASETAKPVARPNIVFIMADDHAWQAVSAYGESRHLIQTPNIDRLGSEGMRFDRCLVNNALCGPARASILTGTYSHINGFYNNTDSRFDGSQITFPKLLQQAGYQTAVIGKWHLETDPIGFDYWEILPGQGIYHNPPMIRDGQRVKHEGYPPPTGARRFTTITTNTPLVIQSVRITASSLTVSRWHISTGQTWITVNSLTAQKIPVR